MGTYLRIRPPRKSTATKSYTLLGKRPGAVVSSIKFPILPLALDTRSSLKQREELEFNYSRVFDHDVNQDVVFENVCQDIIRSAMDGYNGTILAYGQTGSGKTFTITGGESYHDRGMIPRTISALFDAFETRSDMSYRCFVSYLEIYNENVYDLLDKSHINKPIEEWTKIHLQLSDDDDDDVHFRNLGVYEANSEEDALNLLFLGNVNRVTSETPMNQASSRSHSIFTILIEGRRNDSEVVLNSKLHIVDLAGSERVYKRDGSERVRNEGRCINLSLHHLEQVILALQQRNNKKGRNPHIPYRNSMLTSVLRGSLGGNCKSVFIGTLNPEAEYVDESISTCRFMLRCSEVAVDIRVNRDLDSAALVTMLQQENAQLKCEKAALEENVAHHIEINAELQAQLASNKTPRPLTEIDKGVCERLVERFLVAETNDTDALEALHHLGLAHAIECLALMKASIVFASNTAADAQEMLVVQDERMKELEARLLEQRADADRLKTHIVQLTQHINALEDSPPAAADDDVDDGEVHDDEDDLVSESDAESDRIDKGSEVSPAKPSSAVKGESASDSIKRRMEVLKQGAIFIKHGRQGKPHARFVWCSNDLQYLSYRPVGSQGPMIQIPTSSLNALAVGQTTKVLATPLRGANVVSQVFLRRADRSRNDYCFSLFYDDRKRSLDLEARPPILGRTDTYCLEWTEALQFLIKWKSAQRSQAQKK
ncbi:kinesin-like protein [Achlya hypogyna]|uniref:Kinesin-like protein n=1 Tax=Achlya hypogyna TaxID=1202772 RepID=A0A1V9ZM69_ACHHY|nr:kinesin-like protein [Achlya hypogyna]